MCSSPPKLRDIFMNVIHENIFRGSLWLKMYDKSLYYVLAITLSLNHLVAGVWDLNAYWEDMMDLKADGLRGYLKASVLNIFHDLLKTRHKSLELLHNQQLCSLRQPTLTFIHLSSTVNLVSWTPFIWFCISLRSPGLICNRFCCFDVDVVNYETKTWALHSCSRCVVVSLSESNTRFLFLSFFFLNELVVPCVQ